MTCAKQSLHFVTVLLYLSCRGQTLTIYLKGDKQNMEIKKQWGEFSKPELFNISQGSKCTLLKNVEEGKEFTVQAAVIMSDEVINVETGETRQKDILHMKTDEGIFTTESPTVIKTFSSAVEFMENHALTFKLMRGKSKNNRPFMDLELIG